MAKEYDVSTSEENPVITIDALQSYHQFLQASLSPIINSGEAHYIFVECSEDYNGHTFTATHKDGAPVFSAKAADGLAVIAVTTTGSFTVSNDVNEETVEVFVGDVTTVEFISFKATVNVTIPASLVGSVITCSLDGKEFKETSSSTKVTFTVNKAGTWNIGVEGNEYVKTTVVVSDDKGTYSATLDVSTGVPRISVTTNKKVEGKTLKCTKSDKVLTQIVKNNAVEFIVPELGEWTISCDDFAKKTVNVNVAEAKTYATRFAVSTIYGVRVFQNESDPKARVEYVEGASGMTPVSVNTDSGVVNYNGWDKTWIFDKIYPVMLKYDGTEDYKLNPNDYSQKLAGGASDVANVSYQGNAMVHIDKFYSKYYESGGYEYYLICDEPETGFEPIGFKRADNSVMNYGYLPMFKGFIDSGGKLRSLSGQSIKFDTSYNDFRTAALKNGANYCLEPHGFVNLFDILYLILSKNDNCQAAFGRGRDYSGAKTGMLNTRGAIALDTSSKRVKFMHVEDYWGNDLYSWMDGYMYQGSAVYIKWGGPYNSTSTSGYTKVNGAATSSGYISKSMANMAYGRIPTACSGSETTYQCDYWNTGSGSTIYACYRGGNGLWYRSLDAPAAAYSDFCSALSYEPPK